MDYDRCMEDGLMDYNGWTEDAWTMMDRGWRMDRGWMDGLRMAGWRMD